MKQKFILMMILIALALASLAGCAGDGNSTGAVKASGRVSANEVDIGPEIGGQVVEVRVQEGDAVKAGDVLFRLDDKLLRAQEDQAKAAVQTADAALTAARAQAEAARVQQSLAIQNARLQDQKSRVDAWAADQSSEINLPIWYFQKTEQIGAAEDEVKAAETYLKDQAANLDQALNKTSNAGFVSTEKRLAGAQAAFVVAVDVLDQAKSAKNNDTLNTAATDTHDQALKDLEAAQLEYRRVVTTNTAKEVLEARSRVAIAQARLDNARDRLSALQSGDQSLQLEAARAGVTQADAVVSQTGASLAQAKAALQTITVQIEKSTVRAPVAGVILSLSLEVGEIASPGGVVLTIGQLDQVELLVYVPESVYGKVKIGQVVSIQVDSFPGKTFDGKVSAIANEAEFTPRNVQTVDGRKTTVYAVKIAVPNPDQSLKPGMPADVTIKD